MREPYTPIMGHCDRRLPMPEKLWEPYYFMALEHNDWNKKVQSWRN